MVVRSVRLGSPRSPHEGIRIGTVRMVEQAAGAAQWQAFTRKYRAEMAQPEHSRRVTFRHHAADGSRPNQARPVTSETACKHPSICQLLPVSGPCGG